ncbi:MAG: class I SAM-dependent methyltransferase [Nitrososphaerota archaeon]|nr:class I SAM-dependent methyltransferase [Nitrososphaerota archaeon]
MTADPYQEEWKSPEKAFAYLRKVDKIPHRTEGEDVLMGQMPPNVKRVLDLGTGSGRLLSLVKARKPDIEGVALDYSETMLSEARKRFANDKKIKVFSHDLRDPLPAIGNFDAIVSSFAIHHLTHERKKEIYSEIYELLNPDGVFCNLDHVASPTEALHLKFLKLMNQTPEVEDHSNKLLDVESQLCWLREIGFSDVDCHWKWLEFALLCGSKS